LVTAENNKGMIVKVQRFSTQDGPGIRTTVFLKGCPLSCLWCSNPETQSMEVQLEYDWNRCDDDCIECINVCIRGALARRGKRVIIHREKCIRDGACTRICHKKALMLVGVEMTVAQVMTEILKDKPFYARSGGGVTISGGEPLNQARFTLELAKSCNQSGISTVLDTCGFCTWKALEKALAYFDMVYFDLKHMDSLEHRRLTGVDNSLILDNCCRLSAKGVPMFLRMPLIPGLNDKDENLSQLIHFVRKLPSYEELHLLPYHRIGKIKYEMLGLEYCLSDLQQPKKETVLRVAQFLMQAGIKVKVVW